MKSHHKLLSEAEMTATKSELQKTQFQDPHRLHHKLTRLEYFLWTKAKWQPAKLPLNLCAAGLHDFRAGRLQVAQRCYEVALGMTKQLIQHGSFHACRNTPDTMPSIRASRIEKQSKPWLFKTRWPKP